MGLFGFFKKKKVTMSDMERAIWICKNRYEVVTRTGKDDTDAQIVELLNNVIAKGERGELGEGNLEYCYALHAMMPLALDGEFKGVIRDNANNPADLWLIGPEFHDQIDRKRAIRLMREYMECSEQRYKQEEAEEIEEERKKRKPHEPWEPYPRYELFLLALMVEDEQERFELMRESSKRNQSAATCWLYEHKLLEKAFPDRKEMVLRLHQMFINAEASIGMFYGWLGYEKHLMWWIIREAGFPSSYVTPDHRRPRIPELSDKNYKSACWKMLQEWFELQAIEALKKLNASKCPEAAPALKDCQERYKKVLEKEKRRQQQLAELKIQAEVIQRIREEEGL